MSRRAAFYGRISKDRHGTGLAIDRQRDECRGVVDRRGWTWAGEWTDSVSGSGRKKRPGFADLLDTARRGEVDAIVAWNFHRLTRNARDRLDLVEVCRDRGIVIALAQGADLDPTTPNGRLQLGILGEVAQNEIDEMTERIQLEKNQAATSGKYRGGPRPYGFASDGTTPIPAEADALRDATSKILHGESVAGVVRWLNEAGHRTTSGKLWAPVTLRRVLVRGRNAGLIEREHRGRAGDGRTEPDIIGPAVWPAIVAEPEWRQVRRILVDPARRVSPSNDHRWLGSGVYRCGRCDDDTLVRSATARSGGEYHPAYRCRSGAHLSRLAAPVDEFVDEVIVGRLTRPDARTLLDTVGDADLDALYLRRDELDDGIRDVARLVARKVFTAAEAEAAMAENRAELEKINAEIRDSTVISPLSGIVDAPDVAEAWHAASIARRKAVVRALVRVTLLPARKGRPPGWTPGTRYFNPADQVRIEWIHG